MHLAGVPNTQEEVLEDFPTRELRHASRRMIAEEGRAEASVARLPRNAGVAKGTCDLDFRNVETLLVGPSRSRYPLEKSVRGAPERPVESRSRARFPVEVNRSARLDDLGALRGETIEGGVDIVVAPFLHGTGTGER